jgi:hypothetical protein
MKNNYNFQKQLFRFLFCLSLFLLQSVDVLAQPSRVEGHWRNADASWNSNIGTLQDRGTVLGFRAQSLASSGTRNLLLNNSGGNYNPKWVASNTTPYTFNTRLTNGAVYNGAQDIRINTTQNSYYTILVGKNAGSSNDISILQTPWNPRNINSVSGPGSVIDNAPATISVTLDGALQTGTVNEQLWLRYSKDGFATSFFIQITSFSGNTGTVDIPGAFNTSGATVHYYSLTTHSGITLLQANTDYQSLNFRNTIGQNVLGANFSYTVSAGPSIPILAATTAATAITQTSATSGGNVTDQGASAVTERGIVYATTANPTTANTKVISGSGTGTFSANLTGLTAGTTYFVRAYAINAQGTGYGSQISFTTDSPPPPVSILGAFSGWSDVFMTHVSGNDYQLLNYTLPSGDFKFRRNSSWTSGNHWGGPTTFPSGTAVTDGPNINATAGTYNITFNTSTRVFNFAAVPTVPILAATTAATSITQNSATSGGNVTDQGASAVTERGIVYATTTNPTTANTKVISGSGTGTFTANLTGLSPSTLYYVRAYAINAQGTGYGSQISFTTSAPPPTPINVTYRVNMSEQTPISGTVYVRGSHVPGGWDPGSPMTHVGGNVYEFTQTLNSGTTGIQYKFFYNNWENPSGACVSGGNRFLPSPLPATDVTTPLNCFGSCSACPNLVPVTFQVDMNNEIIGCDQAYVVGNFQGWNNTATPLNHIGGGIYTRTVNIAEGTVLEYRFAKNFNAIHETVPGGCQVASSRNFTVPATATTLPLVSYGSCSVNAPINRVNVTFRVDMASVTPTPTAVRISGNLLEWGTTCFPMINTSGTIWERTINLPVDASFQYKFMNGATGSVYEPNLSGGCNSGNNRTLTIPTTSTVLDIFCWGSCNLCIPNDWITVSSGDYHTGSTWNQGTVPPNTADIQILSGHTVTANSTITFNSVNVSANGRLNANENITITNGGTNNGLIVVAPNKVLFATGGTLNSPGTGMLRMESGASLMHGNGTPGGGGSVTGNFSLRRQGHTGLRYNYWSAPMQNVSVNVLGNTKYIYNPLLGNDDPTDDAFDPGWIVPSGNMQQGVGYAALGAGNILMSGENPYQGQLNGTIQNPNAPATRNNLIGNMYPSAISCSAFVQENFTSTNRIEPNLYFWDNPSNISGYTSSDYAVWNSSGSVAGGGGNVPNGNIAPGQGFFVTVRPTYVPGGSGNITFRNEMRTTNGIQFFDATPIERVRLSITNPANAYNETLIAFLPEATDGFDDLYDAPKMKGNKELSFYSKINDDAYAIQGLSLLNQNKTVNLGIDATLSGAHTLKLKELENYPSTSQIYLEDRELKVLQNLRLNDTYVFSKAMMDLKDRFAIHFSAPFEMNTVVSSCETPGKFTISNPSLEAVNYQLKNADNFTIEFGELNDNVLEIENLLPGTYNMIFNWADGYSTIKTFTIEGETPFFISTNQESVTIIAEESINISAIGNNYVQIYWVLDGMTVGHGANLQLTIQDEGTYSLVLVASNEDCEYHINVPVFVSANSTTNVSNISGANYLKIYPNPAAESATLILDAFEDNQFVISVFDAQQRIVYSEQLDFKGKNKLHILNTSDLSSGIYFVTVRSNKTIKSSKLLISK